MEHKEWSDLRRKIAVEMFVIEATDVMIPANEARRNAAILIAKSDGASAADEQGNAAVQRWRKIEYSAGAALIAIDRLGMRLVSD